MKTIDIKVVEQPIKFMRKLYKKCLLNDETFHFVNWANFKWNGHEFEGNHILLRIDEERLEQVKKYLKSYYGTEFTIYDYPFPKRRGHLNRFGLGRRSPEAAYPEIFHQIYHLYSLMSLKMENPKMRQKALMQLLHIPLNVYALSFISEASLYADLAAAKIRLLAEYNK